MAALNPPWAYWSVPRPHTLLILSAAPFITAILIGFMLFESISGLWTVPFSLGALAIYAVYVFSKLNPHHWVSAGYKAYTESRYLPHMFVAYLHLAFAFSWFYRIVLRFLSHDLEQTLDIHNFGLYDIFFGGPFDYGRPTSFRPTLDWREIRGANLLSKLMAIEQVVLGLVEGLQCQLPFLPWSEIYHTAVILCYGFLTIFFTHHLWLATKASWTVLLRGLGFLRPRMDEKERQPRVPSEHEVIMQLGNLVRRGNKLRRGIERRRLTRRHYETVTLPAHGKLPPGIIDPLWVECEQLNARSEQWLEGLRNLSARISAGRTPRWILGIELEDMDTAITALEKRASCAHDELIKIDDRFWGEEWASLLGEPPQFIFCPRHHPSKN
ncbi:hypothetical protein B0T22DRAFT_444971 [Podospora appendiculata]|uniref:Uncharacterized protein n=1 Tax=Podospora appendiculata TaxID=314037 RepID=A0AAE1C8J4_9PEZI|nr:hypothetical protein B0T22DRAFT_444971 [Podospora appendiculata]